MLKKEEIESWNNLFPNCQITENELANPSEHFLTRILCTYLRKFGYKVELVDMGADMLHEKRFFLIKLVHHIDHILKISHNTYTFTYFDLISPTRKRTSIVLSILLNYLHYYNMYQMDTLSKTNERLQMFQQLQETVQRFQNELQEQKSADKKLKDLIEQLRVQIAKLNVELQKLNEDFKTINTELDEGRDKMRMQEAELNKLYDQKTELMAQVVTNKEAEDLQLQIKEQELEIENMREKKKNVEIQAKEMKDTMFQLQEMQEQMEQVSKIAEKSEATLLEFQEQCKLLTHKLKICTECDEKKKELGKKIALHKQSFVLLQQEWEAKRVQMEQKIENILISIDESESVLKSFKESHKIAEEQRKQIELKLEQQNDIGHYLEEHIAQLTLKLPKYE